MKQAICDKCGKIIEEEDFNKIHSVQLPYFKTYHGNGSCWQEKRYDLCDYCVNELNELINKVKCDFINKGVNYGREKKI